MAFLRRMDTLDSTRAKNDAESGFRKFRFGIVELAHAPASVWANANLAVRSKLAYFTVAMDVWAIPHA